ncbi:MAG: RHS repeat-associated core domain-containing protein [Haliscomenobacter sp.]|uniref:RHS repeat-associated core domain-containing protein n=1 Tax=Haliscomenobacter sp. TaxID=2717303 RepID=UPI0029ADC837|nr:RHS repeat-associated core domain-containing protein [Haliscomenobacter sp.]MDX2072064.1 RHS repeat-associated core domain-containing protein [Haliscomenobacter sp.]
MRKQAILSHIKLKAFIISIGLLAWGQLTWAQDVNNTKPNILGPNGVSVNSYSGNLFLNRSDLFIPGQGLNLEIVFAYNTSKRGRDWGFGRGWVLNYNMACMPDSAGIALERMDGRRDVFTRKNGSLVAPAGVFETLQEYEVGKFKLLSKNGTAYYFENAAHHRLTKITDRNNNTLALSYTDTLLAEVSDAAGRKLSFTWAQGRLQKINTNTKPARSIQFQYDKSGNPIRVINPGGGTREYRYDEASKIITVIDENGNPVNIDYNSNEAATKISSCFGTQNIFYDYNQYKTHVTERVANELQLTTYEYDTLGLLKAQTGNCCGYSMRFFYDAQKNISKKIDANGNEMLYTYDGKGNLLQSVDALQQIEQWQYEPVFNQIIKMTDKNGNIRNYEYDAKGNLTKITHPLGIIESYTYDESGNRIRYTDGNGNTTHYEYNSSGYLTKVTDPNQGITLNEYDELGNLLTSTDPNQHKTQWVYDDLNRIITTIDALNQSETYEYDNVGNVLSSNDKSGNQTQYTYDALNRLTLIKNALGGTQLFEYDVRGNLRRWVDENKNVTQYSYDLLNRLAEVKNALGERTIFDYDNNGNLTGVILPNGNEMSLSYDKLDRLSAVQDKIGLLAQMGYDKNSNRISFTDANSNTYTFSYDALNRLIKQADPLNGELNLSYDKNSNVNTLTDQNGHTTTYTYDKLNRRIAVKDAINATSNYSFDPAGNPMTVIDQNGNQTQYKYDALDRLVEEIYPDASTMQYRYNPTNQVISRTDNNGKITTYTFDPLYRLTGRSYADGSQEGFNYDARGNLLSAQNQYALVRFTYDALHRRSTETLNTYQSNFTYDTKNRKRSITYPSGRKLNLNLDERNRLQEILDPLLGETPLAKFEYNPLGQLSKLSYANTTVNDMTYDANARITGLQYAFKNQNQSYQYNYDKLGNRTRELNNTQADRSRVYAYDAIDRLAQVQEGVISGSNTIVNPIRQGKYTFDAIGNRKSAEEQQQSKTYTSNTLNQYTNISQGNTNRSLSYDKNGNLTFDGQFNLGYDLENRLTAVDNGTTALYRYDALGRRIQKIIKQDTTFYLYNGLDLIEERGNKGLLKASFVYGDNIDQVLSMQRSGKNYYYHSDPLGSARKISDEAGNVVEQYEYDAYGQVRFFNGTGQVLGTSAIGNPFLFTGREYDVETGMYHYRARSFSTELGRFGQRDPLGFVDGLNEYAYVINNPVNFVDPNGTNTTCLQQAVPIIQQIASIAALTGVAIAALPAEVITAAAVLATGAAIIGTATLINHISSQNQTASSVHNSSINPPNSTGQQQGQQQQGQQKGQQQQGQQKGQQQQGQQKGQQQQGQQKPEYRDHFFPKNGVGTRLDVKG